MHIKYRLLILLSVVVVTFSGCSRKHRYLQAPRSAAQQEVVYQKVLEEYKLQPNDILYINVLTAIAEYTGLFNPNSGQQQLTNMTGPTIYLTGYPVDIAGNIETPLIGKTQVAGLTVAEVEQLIHEKISKIVYDSQVVVRLAGFRINVVGEVKAPGEYTVYRDHANVMEALSMAGDMNYYGNRREIMIYRTTKEGVTPYTIDLTDRNALLSPVFYLQPNDMIYVQPLPRTIFRVNLTDIVTYLSAISSSLAMVVAIVSLTNNN